MIMKTKEKEIWRNIPNYDGYQASNMGRVRSVNRTVVDSRGGERFYRGRILYGNINKTTGYRRIKLFVNGKCKSFNTSQIIAMTYLSHTPEGHTFIIDHVNGVKTDDRLSNLRIVTQRANSSTCFRKDRGSFSSKHVGVSWSKSNSKWRSQIQYEGEIIYLGYYDNELEASKAYQDALVRIEDGTFNVNDYEPNFTSKFRGVVFHKQAKKWMSYTRVNGKQKYFGLYPTELEASKAYEKALSEINSGTFKQEVKNTIKT